MPSAAEAAAMVQLLDCALAFALWRCCMRRCRWGVHSRYGQIYRLTGNNIDINDVFAVVGGPIRGAVHAVLQAPRVGHDVMGKGRTDVDIHLPRGKLLLFHVNVSGFRSARCSNKSTGILQEDSNPLSRQ